MDMQAKIKDVQKHLIKEGIDGWLLYDFRKTNDLAIDFLEIPKEKFLTRRFFYWIPSSGDPVKIVHAIEQKVMDNLPGKTSVYLKWQELHECLAHILKNAKRVAMEYSPQNNIPYISKVDGGTIDLIRTFGAEVVSSAPFLQYYTCVWDKDQFKMHLQAASVLDEAAKSTWEWIKESLNNNQRITEYDVQQRILEEIHRKDCEMEGMPICAVNANSADPHYMPSSKESSVIKKGDFILIDLWCKKRAPKSVYADITRVAVADFQPSKKQLEVFQIVRRAQKESTDFVEQSIRQKKTIKGYEVDQICRKVIEDAGYGKFFTHRTGHNIYTQDHGPGAHIDSLETLDERPLIPNTCFSIEPGIYLPGEFGIRLEYDVCILDNAEIKITGGIQEEIVVLF